LRESAERGEVRRIAVVGGGAAGIEVLLAMQHGLAGVAAEFALFRELPILAGHGARRRIARILGARGRRGALRPEGPRCEQGRARARRRRRFEAQAAVWATGARAPSWIAPSGTRDRRARLRRGERHAAIAVVPGDIRRGRCRNRGRPAQAEIRRLRREAGPGSRAQSAPRASGGGSAEPFRPPTRSLALISCGDRYAVASWGEFALEGAWVWRWKDRIDRRFVERYRLGPAGG